MAAARKPEQRSAYFWASVKVGAPDDCWPWQGGFFQRPSGSEPYGRFAWEKTRSLYAHRLAYQLANGLPEYPAGDVTIMHICDNPRCCNPAHLRSGTARENAEDRDAKGRQVRGERSPHTPFTEADIRYIRTSELTGSRLAKDFGVSKTSISCIRKRKTWKHVL